MGYREIRDVAESNGEFEAWALLARRLGSESTVSWPFTVGRSHVFCHLTPHLVGLIETAFRNELRNQTLWLPLSSQAKQHFHYGLVVREVVATASLAGRSFNPKTVDDALVLGEDAQIPVGGLAQAYFELSQQKPGLKNPVQDLRGFFSEKGLVERFAEVSLPDPAIDDALVEVADAAPAGHPSCSELITTAVVYFLLHRLLPEGSGQVTRLLSSGLLAAIFSPATALTFSQTVSSRREIHEVHLASANDEKNLGDLTPFIVGFVDVVVAAQEHIHEHLDRLTAQLGCITSLAISQKPTERILFLVAQAALCGNEWGITLEEATRFVARGPQQTRTYLTELEKQNLVYRPRKRPQRFALDALGWARLHDLGIGDAEPERHD
ncbi:MAG: hypothetical protein Q4D85_07215 [Corynebacterium sp.]|uniref:hypothetical protein n=1 Tax=Corynebacterium sp. TaxID=1720 RepID=UPI0026DC8637|nr:hypothetical protein [Corynebacterium sp.]MDO5098536.1 hypothetical protein [Corynebacterium sp.]